MTPRFDPLAHPMLPVPAIERQRVAVAARLALQGVAAGEALARNDLRLLARMVGALADPARLDGAEDARQAAQEALQALDDCEAGATPWGDAPARCAPAVEVFERLLVLVPRRRLVSAQEAAMRELCARVQA